MRQLTGVTSTRKPAQVLTHLHCGQKDFCLLRRVGQSLSGVFVFTRRSGTQAPRVLR